MEPPSVQRRVEGESLDLLSEAIGQFKRKQEPNGMWTFEVHLEPRLANPFVRAFMRVESRLLREDADLYDLPGMNPRTDEQRKIDALKVLVTSVANARRASRRTTAADGAGTPGR